MRTNIVIDDELLAEAIALTGAKSEREAVELSLKTLVQLKKQERIRAYRSKLIWLDKDESEIQDRNSSV